MAILNSSPTISKTLLVVANTTAQDLVKWVLNNGLAKEGLSKGSRWEEHRINFMTKILS